MMQAGTPANQIFYQGFIARQALFDAKCGIWGYEIIYRQSLDARTATNHKAMLRLATRAFLSPQWQRSPNAYLLVTLEPQSDLDTLTMLLPRDRSVFKISEEMLVTPAMATTLTRLRQEGHLIALGDFSGKLAGSAALDLVDVFTVDMQRGNRDALIMEALWHKEQRPVQILAKKVEDAQTFSAAQTVGCTLFQGFFFQKPERISSKVVSSSLAASLGILKMLEQEAPDISALAEAIQRDVSLSFRLLKFLNSPYFGFAREVSSIKVALILAGWEQMRTWLRLVLITEMKPKHKPSELIFLSAQRGRFLELAAQRTLGRRMNSERLLLLGLFSLLDSIFDMQMPDILGSLPLDQELKDTLCLRPTALLPWLELVHGFERADWQQLPALFEALGVDPVEVAACYNESMQWANSVFNHLD